MKKKISFAIYICIILFSTACRLDEPEFHISDLQSVEMEEGDYLFVHLSDMGGTNLTTASDGSVCKVIYPDRDREKVLLFAFRPGYDTIYIEGSYYPGGTSNPPVAFRRTLYVEVTEKTELN